MATHSVSLGDQYLLLKEAMLLDDKNRNKLLSKFNFGVTDNNNNTLLHYAIRNGRKDNDFYRIVELLAKKDFLINARNRGDETPLEIECYQKYACVSKVLIDNGAEVNKIYFNSRTLLHEACRINTDNLGLGLVKLLVNSGASINARDSYGCTPLHFASRNRRTATMRVLLKAGAHLETKNKRGETPLKSVCYSPEYNKASCLLIRKGASVRTKDRNGETPLHKCNHYPMGAILVQNGAPINERSNLGETPLHTLCRKVATDTRLIIFMIRSGALLNAQSNSGSTPLNTACYNGNFRTAQILIEEGADPNIKTNLGEIPLHYICYRGCIDTLILLNNKHGIGNRYDKNWIGETPIDLAIKVKNSEIIDFIEGAYGPNNMDTK